MNGHPRDQVDTDLRAGRPTISPLADPLAERVVALMSESEARELSADLEARARRSPAFADWLADPTRYLAELDPGTAAGIEAYLAELHERLARRARERGWEVERADGP